MKAEDAELPEGWVYSDGVFDLPSTPMPLLAYRVLSHVERYGSAYVQNDGGFDVLESLGLLVGLCGDLGLLCLQETAFVYQPAVVSNISAGSGFLIVNKKKIAVEVPIAVGQTDG